MEDKEKEWYQRYFTKYPRIGGTLRRRKRAYYSEIVEDFKHLDGMSLSSIKRYELGTSDCPASVIFALALYYQCNIQELFDDDASFGRDIDQRKDNFRFSEISYKETPTGPSYDYAEEIKGYRLDYGLKLNKGDYDLITLEHDHQTLNLPKGAKLFFR
ncbi:MAG: helix-turn-helix domain-containing protein, partial [Candidatus Izemoplasmataceae bacterium]